MDTNPAELEQFSVPFISPNPFAARGFTSGPLAIAETSLKICLMKVEEYAQDMHLQLVRKVLVKIGGWWWWWLEEVYRSNGDKIEDGRRG